MSVTPNNPQAQFEQNTAQLTADTQQLATDQNLLASEKSQLKTAIAQMDNATDPSQGLWDALTVLYLAMQIGDTQMGILGTQLNISGDISQIGNTLQSMMTNSNINSSPATMQDFENDLTTCQTILQTQPGNNTNNSPMTINLGLNPSTSEALLTQVNNMLALFSPTNGGNTPAVLQPGNANPPQGSFNNFSALYAAAAGKNTGTGSTSIQTTAAQTIQTITNSFNTISTTMNSVNQAVQANLQFVTNMVKAELGLAQSASSNITKTEGNAVGLQRAS